MSFLRTILSFVLSYLLIVQVGSVSPFKYNVYCDKLTGNASFSEQAVLGKKWRTYYAWNPIENQCEDIKFKPVNHLLIANVRRAMKPYMVKSPPNWSDATLFMKISPEKYQALLIPDGSRLPGHYYEVPYVPNAMARAASPIKRKVDLLPLRLRLLKGGQYLFYVQCYQEYTFLLRVVDREDKLPDRKEIKEVADSLNLVDGTHICF